MYVQDNLGPAYPPGQGIPRNAEHIGGSPFPYAPVAQLGHYFTSPRSHGTVEQDVHVLLQDRYVPQGADIAQGVKRGPDALLGEPFYVVQVVIPYLVRPGQPLVAVLVGKLAPRVHLFQLVDYQFLVRILLPHVGKLASGVDMTKYEHRVGIFRLAGTQLLEHPGHFGEYESVGDYDVHAGNIAKMPWKRYFHGIIFKKLFLAVRLELVVDSVQSFHRGNI